MKISASSFFLSTADIATWRKGGSWLYQLTIMRLGHAIKSLCQTQPPSFYEKLSWTQSFPLVYNLIYWLLLCRIFRTRSYLAPLSPLSLSPKTTKHKAVFINLSLNGNCEGVKCIVDFKSPWRYDESSASALRRWSNSIDNSTIENVIVILEKTRLGDVLRCLRYFCRRGRIYWLRQQQVRRSRIDGLL